MTMPEEDRILLTESILDQWESSAIHDAEVGNPWSTNPLAILALLPLARAGMQSVEQSIARIHAAYPGSTIGATERVETKVFEVWAHQGSVSLGFATGTTLTEAFAHLAKRLVP